MDDLLEDVVERAKQDFLKELKEKGACFEWVIESYAECSNAFNHPEEDDDGFYLYGRMRAIEEFLVSNLLFTNGWDVDDNGYWIKKD